MANRNQVAMSVAANKELHPERYCPARRCLWKTAEVGPDGEYVLNADPCRKHPELNTAPSRKGRAESSVTMKTESDHINDLQAQGFSVLKDGAGVIVMGSRDRIPVDRRTDAHDLLSSTRARRFDSARAALQALTKGSEAA